MGTGDQSTGGPATRLWGGRFEGGPADALARLSLSVHFDWRPSGLLERTRTWWCRISRGMPAPSLGRKLFMIVKLFVAFCTLAFSQLTNNKIYEFCFRIIASSKTIKRDE